MTRQAKAHPVITMRDGFFFRAAGLVNLGNRNQSIASTHEAKAFSRFCVVTTLKLYRARASHDHLAQVETPGLSTMSSSPRDSEPEDAAASKEQRMQWSHALDDVDLNWADSSLMVCSFVCGLVDSVAFNAGSVFVSMQTGEISLGEADRVTPNPCAASSAPNLVAPHPNS